MTTLTAKKGIDLGSMGDKSAWRTIREGDSPEKRMLIEERRQRISIAKAYTDLCNALQLLYYLGEFEGSENPKIVGIERTVELCPDKEWYIERPTNN